jgi:cytochrome c2
VGRTGLLTVIALLLLTTARQGAAAGDPEAGAQVFRTCVACHTLEPGVHRTGPSLAGVFGREAGTAEGFHRYSDALRSTDLVWREDTLNGFIADPQAFLPGKFNLRFKTDSSGSGPRPGHAALQPAGMMGDRASVIFADPEEISSFIEKRCQ